MVACLSSPTPFPSAPSLLFSPKFILSGSGLIAEVCLRWPGQERGRGARRLHGHCSLFLGSLGREEVTHLHCDHPCPVYTPGAQASHLVLAGISASRSWDHSTKFSEHLSTKFRGFQKHVARRKLSQFIPWLWSNLFLNQATKSYAYHFLRDIISRSYSLCSFHLMCEV